MTKSIDMTKKIIVVGSGAAGMTAASEAKKTAPGSDVTILTEDKHIAYSPCAIPWVIEGKMDWKDIIMHDPAFYSKKRGITVHTKTKVTAVDHVNKRITAGDSEYKYDSLVIASGGTVFMPPICGTSLKNTFVIRTINDCVAIIKAIEKVKRVAVIGAGVIGLEVAVALRNRGKDVLISEMFDQVIPRIADNDVASRIKEHAENMGIRFIFGKPVGSVEGDTEVTGITVGGRTYDCEMVIFATGVRPNLEIPRMLDLDIGMLGGVVVSPTMQPYRKGRIVDDIYLAGDVIQCSSAVVPGPTMSQLGSSAVKQGGVAGKNAAGGRNTIGPTVSPWISVIGDLEIGGAGLSDGLASWYGIKTVSAHAEGSTSARYYPGGKALYVKLLADASTHVIVGIQMVGSYINGRINWMSSVIASRTSVEEFLYSGENAYCPPTSMVRDTIFAAADDLADKLKKQVS